MSSHSHPGRSRPDHSVVFQIIAGSPWTARYVRDNCLRQHCHVLSRTFRGPNPLTDPLRIPCRRLLAAIVANSNLLTSTHPSEYALIPTIVRIAAYAHRWIRDPETWTHTSAGSPQELLRSLLAHLFAKWPVPAFFDSAWLVKGALNYLERDWYCEIASGRSLRKLPGMPPSITAAALHRTMQAPPHLSIRQALRWGQVMALGGSEALLANVLSSGMVADLSNDAIWSRLLEKVVAARDFASENFGLIADTLLELTTRGECQRAELLIALQLAELLRHSRRLWKRLASVSATNFPNRKKIDIDNANHRAEIRNQNAVQWTPLLSTKPYLSCYRDAGNVIDWRIEELVNQSQLTEESRSLHHCVHGYGRACRSERSAIFSLRTDDASGSQIVSKSHLTIEVARGSRKIVQVRGKWNQVYQPGQVPELRQWADEMGLTV